MNPIDEFLKNKAINTQNNQRWILKEYFKEIKSKPETYFNNNRDYQQDVKNWWLNHINEVPTTRHTKLNAVRGLLEDQEVLFPKKFWRKLRQMKKGTRPATMDRTPSHNEFKKILQYGTVKDKALFLFASSSGMRITEIIQLKPKHIDQEHDPPMIKIPGNISKSGDPRVTFITPEAKEYLLLWLKEREDYIKVASSRTILSRRKNRHDDTIFPFHYSIAHRRWAYLIKKAGLDQKDETTNRYVLHIHCLRKWFLSQLKLSIPVTIAEALAGHEQYLDEAYRRYTKEQLGEYYKKGMENLTVLKTTPDLSEHNDRILQLEKENADLIKRVKDLELLVAIDKRMDDKINHALNNSKTQ